MMYAVLLAMVYSKPLVLCAVLPCAWMLQVWDRFARALCAGSTTT
jgi:hypothetical protein